MLEEKWVQICVWILWILYIKFDSEYIFALAMDNCQTHVGPQFNWTRDVMSETIFLIMTVLLY